MNQPVLPVFQFSPFQKTFHESLKIRKRKLMKKYKKLTVSKKCRVKLRGKTKESGKIRKRKKEEDQKSNNKTQGKMKNEMHYLSTLIHTCLIVA